MLPGVLHLRKQADPRRARGSRSLLTPACAAHLPAGETIDGAARRSRIGRSSEPAAESMARIRARATATGSLGATGCRTQSWGVCHDHAWDAAWTACGRSRVDGRCHRSGCTKRHRRGRRRFSLGPTSRRSGRLACRSSSRGWRQSTRSTGPAMSSATTANCSSRSGPRTSSPPSPAPYRVPTRCSGLGSTAGRRNRRAGWDRRLLQRKHARILRVVGDVPDQLDPILVLDLCRRRSRGVGQVQERRST